MPPITQPPPPPSNRAVGSAVEQCAPKHWIVVKLIRMPDQKKRESWWPVRLVEAYKSEPFSAEITNGHKDGSLNAAGMVRYDKIPPGSCQFHFNKFYDEIEQYFNKQLK